MLRYFVVYDCCKSILLEALQESLAKVMSLDASAIREVVEIVNLQIHSLASVELLNNELEG